MKRFKQYLEEKLNHTYKFSSVQFPYHNYDIVQTIMDFGKNIPESAIYTEENDNSYGLEDEYHTTVLYGIVSEDSNETKMLFRRNNIQPFKVKLGKITFFEAENYRVMKVDVESDELYRINKLLRENLEYKNKFPEYKPHMTIGYLKKDLNENEFDFNESLFEGKEEIVKEVVFSSKSSKKEKILLGDY